MPEARRSNKSETRSISARKQNDKRGSAKGLVGSKNQPPPGWTAEMTSTLAPLAGRPEAPEALLGRAGPNVILNLVRFRNLLDRSVFGCCRLLGHALQRQAASVRLACLLTYPIDETP